MENTLIAFGQVVENNVNAEICLWIAASIAVPAALYGLYRYAKAIIFER